MDTITSTLDTVAIQEHSQRAGKARREGVKLYRDNVTGAHYATSVSQPGKWHYVTLLSCDCVGFVNHGHCKHHSALVMAKLLQETGQTPEPTELPVATAPEPCRQCDGRGYWIKAKQVGRGQFTRDDITCPHCHGRGHTVAA